MRCQKFAKGYTAHEEQIQIQVYASIHSINSFVSTSMPGWHCFMQWGKSKQILSTFCPLLLLSDWHNAAPVQNIPESRAPG